MNKTMLMLQLHNYRRLQQTDEIFFSSGLTIVSGPNGAGKSTLAEAFIYALYGPKQRTKGLTMADIHTDNVVGNVKVECKLFIDDQLVHIIRNGNGAELRINNAVQVQNMASSGTAASAYMTKLLGGLTRNQFERTYVALQGDTAGLVESTGKARREIIEQILQLDVLTQAVELQARRSEQAKSDYIAFAKLICTELTLTDNERDLITSFQNARTTRSQIQHAQKFAQQIERVLTEQQRQRIEAEKRVIQSQLSVDVVQQKCKQQLVVIEQAEQAYRRQELLQVEYNRVNAQVVSATGQLKQVELDLQTNQESIHNAELYADASKEYAELQTLKQRYEDRMKRLPFVEQCYSACEQARKRVNDITSQLETFVQVDAEFHAAQDVEKQAIQYRDTLRKDDPTSSAYTEWLGQDKALSLEEQQNKKALEQLRSGTGDARCPTCHQQFKEHSSAQRIQHLHVWLNETLPPLRAELMRQKQRLVARQKQWQKEQEEADVQCTTYHQQTTTLEMELLRRNALLEQMDEALSRFREAQQIWQDLQEVTPDPQEQTTLQSRLRALMPRIEQLKEGADLYASLPFLHQNLQAKQKAHEEHLVTIQSLGHQQASIGYDPETFLKAKTALESRQEEDKHLRDEFYLAEARLKEEQHLALQAVLWVNKIKDFFDRFGTNVREYRNEEQLRIHLDTFKKHFFVANTEEVLRRTTELLLYAVTDQSILGVSFDRDNFLYNDASNVAHPISRLSGGEKALLGLCLRIALAEQAQAITKKGRVKFLILDEVLSSLDEERCEAVQRIFEDVHRHGIFEHIIMITHLDSVKQDWRAHGLAVQKVDGKISKVISVSPGDIFMDLTEEIEV